MKEKRKVKKQRERGERYIHGIKVCQLVGCTKKYFSRKKEEVDNIIQKNISHFAKSNLQNPMHTTQL